MFCQPCQRGRKAAGAPRDDQGAGMKGWLGALSTASEPGLRAPYMPATVLLPLNQGGGGGDVDVGMSGRKSRSGEQSEAF